MKFCRVLLAFFLLAFTLATTLGKDVQVKGHFRKDGTYVQPHHRSAPDGNFNNNWSTKGNVNPYTGKDGTKETPPSGATSQPSNVLESFPTQLDNSTQRVERSKAISPPVVAIEKTSLYEAAAKGDAQAQFELGMIYSEGKDRPADFDKACEWQRKAAAQGNTSAKYQLGVMCQTGKGMPKDYGEAVKWYREAAEKGDAKAQFALAWMHEKGKGVAQDYSKAANWYRKAAPQGDPTVQYNLGVLCEHGLGMPKDYIEAYKWFNLSASHGFEHATQARTNLEEKMTPEQIAEGQRRSTIFQKDISN